MSQSLQDIRDNRNCAHIVPFGVFMAVMLIQQFFFDPFFRWEHDDAAWWRHYPEQLFYPLQTVLVAGVLAFFWKHYDFRWTSKVWVGVVLGVVGIAIWLLPTTLYDYWGMEGKPDTLLEKLTGLAPRREGFDPGVFENPMAFWASLILRVLRAVVIVSLVEEIFWRGFLMRFVADPDGDYWKVPFGKPTWRSFVVVTAAFMLAHAPVDWLGAFFFGSLMYGCAVWTRSLLACVVMHGVANAVLAWYAMEFEKFGMW